ncbi:hypothetical protein CMV_005504, partial [Castanea mollissima]
MTKSFSPLSSPNVARRYHVTFTKNSNTRRQSMHSASGYHL